jgi:ELAV/HuD family splicing factor
LFPNGYHEEEHRLHSWLCQFAVSFSVHSRLLVMACHDDQKPLGQVDVQKFNPNKVIINYLPDALTDNELSSLFGTIGQVKSTKIIRDKTTGISLGYGFVEYESEDDAARAIEKFDGLNLQQKRLRVAYARWPGTPETIGANIHVRNLELNVTSRDVEEQFGQYGEVVRARVLNDHQSGLSRGIAFVLFGNREDAEHAVRELNGAAIPGFARGQLCVRFAIDNRTKAQAIYAAATGILPGGIAGFPVPQQVAPTLPSAAAAAAQHLVLGTGYGGALGGGPIRAGGIRQRFNPLAAGVTGVPGATAAALTRIASPSGLVRSNASLPVPNAAIDINTLKPHLSALWTNAATSGLPAASIEHPAAGVTAGHIIFVYNLGPDSDDRDLWQLFAPFGAVQKVNIIMDQEKNKCKGYGFVTMTHFDEAMIAISQLNGFVYKERQLQVSLKTPKHRGLIKS